MQSQEFFDLIMFSSFLLFYATTNLFSQTSVKKRKKMYDTNEQTTSHNNLQINE